MRGVLAGLILVLLSGASQAYEASASFTVSLTIPHRCEARGVGQVPQCNFNQPVVREEQKAVSEIVLSRVGDDRKVTVQTIYF